MKEWLLKLGKSFYYAGNGVKTGFRQRNMRIHFIMAVGMIWAGMIFGLSIWEWVLIIMLIGMVWTVELINTSIEELADVLSDTNNLDYKATTAIRDMAAGAVLVISIVAAIVGMIIFGSKLI